MLFLSYIPWLYSWFYPLEVQSSCFILVFIPQRFSRWFSLMILLLGVPGRIPGQIIQSFGDVSFGGVRGPGAVCIDAAEEDEQQEAGGGWRLKGEEGVEEEEEEEE